MKFFIALILIVAAACASPAAEKKIEDEQKELAASFEHFSSQMYKHTSDAKKGENLVMSPFSAHTALAFLSMGAEGSTFDELKKVLGLKDKEFTKSAFGSTMRRLNENQELRNSDRENPLLKAIPTLKVANKVYAMEKYELAPEFKAVAKEAFQSEAENVDFAKSENAAKTINNWVEDKTEKKIKNLVSSGDLNESTRLVLVNAIYFKGDWSVQFEPEQTKKADFFVGKDEKAKTQVDMMWKEAHYDVATIEDWKAKMIKIPFVGRNISMMIVVPDQIDGLATVQSKIVSDGLAAPMKKLTSKYTELRMPKFKIETKLEMNEILKKMGIAKIFESKGELGGLLKTREQMHVSKVVQKAFIDVNEYGCEAAAATAIFGVGSGLILDKPLEFTVNRPFYYAIVDEDGARFFGGNVYKP